MTITFDNITLTQGDFTLTADLSIEEGHKIALLGPSGGGKSTLLSALAGFKQPDQGRILWNGTDITNAHPAKRPITLLFQDHNLFPHLTVAQNIGLGIRPNLRLSDQEHQIVADALTRVGLKGQGPKRPAQLSGGQQQRVAIARALLRDKPILALDEPFAALGPALKHEMLDLVAEIVDTANATLIMVTHQPEDAAWITDQTVLVAEGTAHPPQDTKDLLANPPEVLKAYLGT
ncbi:ATP-binding cassette domain-containing protein [Amylibacter sp. IMCC11727]|uniref:thiamine ABC transporter ATP-binding protein n=1 Tax=Amylibacter sp. IMCC11727 TaxID=3039851 RepID=UPI00244DF5B3|nr:ATP-binding cassette domain-containing protein [Amylibacter sp. IMCC11727]WGI21719.1 ATP-binding cassette domain-containing protein [Amylibacter sp. IMCC11727]